MAGWPLVSTPEKRATFRHLGRQNRMPTALPLRLLSVFLPAGLLLAFAACSSDSDRPEMPLHAIPDYPTTMAGSESFADGRLTAQVTFGQSIGRGSRPENGGSDNAGSPHADGGSSSGGGHHHGGGGMGGGGMGGGMGGGSRPEGMGGDNSPSGNAAPRRGGLAGGPGIQIKLHLTNTSATDTVSCEVLDFKSSLGDFAVFPAKYQLAAGQAAVSETMTSQLGLTSAEIPVTVDLLIGNHRETKVVMVRLLPQEPEKAPTSVGK